MSKFEIYVNVYRGEFNASEIEPEQKIIKVFENIMEEKKVISSYALVPGDII